MTQAIGPEGRSNLPKTTDESVVSGAVPFSILWLQAVDPRIFTPNTWEEGGETTIRLRAAGPADSSIRINVYRAVSHYLVANKIELRDEVYALKPGETEAGKKVVSPFGYKFEAPEQLTGFDPTPDISEHMQSVISKLSELVTIAGSTITATNYRTGPESNFVSNGTQWVDLHTGIAAPVPPAINTERIALNP